MQFDIFVLLLLLSLFSIGRTEKIVDLNTAYKNLQNKVESLQKAFEELGVPLPENFDLSLPESLGETAEAVQNALENTISTPQKIRTLINIFLTFFVFLVLFLVSFVIYANDWHRSFFAKFHRSQTRPGDSVLESSQTTDHEKND